MGLLPSAQTSCFTYIPSPLQESIKDHGIMWVGRDLWKLSSLNFLLKPCPVNVGYSEPILLSLETLQRRRLHSDSRHHSSVWPPSYPCKINKLMCLCAYLGFSRLYRVSVSSCLAICTYFSLPCWSANQVLAGKMDTPQYSCVPISMFLLSS